MVRMVVINYHRGTINVLDAFVLHFPFIFKCLKGEDESVKTFFKFRDKSLPIGLAIVFVGVVDMGYVNLFFVPNLTK